MPYFIPHPRALRTSLVTTSPPCSGTYASHNVCCSRHESVTKTSPHCAQVTKGRNACPGQLAFELHSYGNAEAPPH
jgi:hypothetical protein